MHNVLSLRVRASYFYALLAVSMLFFGCGQHTQKLPMTQNTAPIDTSVTIKSWTLLESTWPVLGSDSNTSSCYSPASLSFAVQMASSGAEGATKTELNQLARPSLQLDSTTSSHAEVANAVWVREGFTLHPAYLNKIAAYHAHAEELPFGTKPAACAIKINRWVSEATHDRIKELLDAPDVAQADLVLTNAIYFKGVWKHPFESAATRKRPFYSTHGELQVEMMHGRMKEIYFAQNQKGKLLVLPYDSGDFFMAFFLPNTDDGTSQPPLASVDAKDITELYNLCSTETAIVDIPKFKVKSKHSLVDPMKRMGMNRCFGSNADFSGITGSRNLHIGEVLQVAEIEVDEKGTEASAATGIIMMRSAHVPDVTFTANRPFLYFVCQGDISNVLFSGVYNGS